MKDDIDTLKIAMDDARTRQKALADLILFTDQQAMGLLRLYATLGAAAASAGASMFLPIPAIPAVLAAGLLGAAAAFIVGAALCFWTMRSADVGLPGRGPDFWLWAMEPAVTLADVGREYLTTANERVEENRKVNRRTARSLGWAKLCGVVAPAAAVAGAGIYVWLVGP